MRLATFADEVTTAAKVNTGQLTDIDLALFEQAGIDQGSFAEKDIAAIAVMLRFGAALREEDCLGAVEFGLSNEGLVVALPLQVLFVLRGRWDDAARLATAALRDSPRGRRSNATWKRWEAFFGNRDDYPKLTLNFKLALLRRFEQGDNKEQQIVQDLLGKPDLTHEQVPTVRKSAVAEWQEFERLYHQARSPAHRTSVWVEDSRGLREVPTSLLRRPTRFEIRLQADTDDSWGTLLIHDDRPDDLIAKLDALRRLAVTSHSDTKDLKDGRGPIAIILSDEPPQETMATIRALDEALTAALATAELLRLRINLELPHDAARHERSTSTAKAILGAVRGAAKRLRELTTAAEPPTVRDAEENDSALLQLRTATENAVAWHRELFAFVPPPSAEAEWRDMKIPDGYPVRVRVRLDEESANIMIADDDLTTRHTQWCTLRREDLRGAIFETDTNSSTLFVTPSRPFLTAHIWLKSLGAGYNTFGIPCDSTVHRVALADALRAFAKGEKR